MTHEAAVHHTLARSYLMYFVASMVGLFADALIAAPFGIPYGHDVAIVLFGAGPLLMLWAQYSSWRCQKHHHSAAYFHHGPYRIVRNPTHLGILLLVAGYTLISGSLLFFAATLIGYLLSNIFFTKYERIFHEKFGEIYKAYTKKTPKI
jgi:protein-S-isoprenylcysteine O-methyltransferase Ste14